MAGLLRLPYELAIVDHRLPVVFRAHMLTSGLALLLLPCAIAGHGRSLHKLLGRSAAALVVAGGITAIPVALASEASAVARAGFLVQALVWIALVVCAVAAIRGGNRTRHMWLMLAVAAVASGAFWLRLASWAAVGLKLPFEPAYATAAWLAWLLPLSCIYLIARRKTVVARSGRSTRTSPSPGAGDRDPQGSYAGIAIDTRSISLVTLDGGPVVTQGELR